MSTTTANMSLLIPDVGDSDYADSIETSLQNIDDHDHSSGNGVQIVTGGITDLAVTTAKLAANAVTTAKITDLNVTAAKLAADAVTTAKILDGNVTLAKLATLTIQSGAQAADTVYSVNSTTPTDVTGLTLSITTVGRPVYVALIGSYLGSLGSYISMFTPEVGRFYFLRDSTIISSHTIAGDGGTASAGMFIPPSVFHIDAPAAGTYTYKIQAFNQNGTSGLFNFYNCKIIAFEL